MIARPLILGLAGVLVALAATMATRLIEPRFTAETLVGPTARAGAAAIGARVPETGAVAPSAIAEPGPADEQLSDFARYLELLRSVPIAERLMADEDFTHQFFAGQWDEAARRWREPPGPWSTIRSLLLTLAGRDTSGPPDVVDMAEALARRVTIHQVGTGPMRRIIFRDPDREFAMLVLSRVTHAADSHLRDEASRRARAQIDHVRTRLATINAAEHRRALAELLSDGERVLMVLGVDLPYAADVIAPVHAPSRPDWPNPLIIAAVAGLATVSIGAALFGWRGRWWREREAANAF